MSNESLIPDELIEKLQQIYSDDANDSKAESVRATIAEYMPAVNPEYTLIKETDLQWMKDQVLAGNQLKIEAERDIGWVIETLATITDKFSTKNLMKLVTGKLDMKTLGIDMDRLEKIGEKFAPNTFARIANQKQKQIQ